MFLMTGNGQACARFYVQSPVPKQRTRDGLCESEDETWSWTYDLDSVTFFPEFSESNF